MKPFQTNLSKHACLTDAGQRIEALTTGALPVWLQPELSHCGGSWVARRQRTNVLPPTFAALAVTVGDQRATENDELMSRFRT